MNLLPPFRQHIPFFLAVSLLLQGLASVSNALKTPIVTCASSSELERAASFFCNAGDKVLEIGAQYDAVSTKLCAAILPHGRAQLVDVQRADVKSGRCTHRDAQAFQSQQNVDIVELKRLEDWKEVIFDSNPFFDVIVIDLGHLIGNDLHLTTLTMTDEVLSLVAAHPPRVVLVKSKSLASLARRLVPAQHLIEGHISIDETTIQRCSEPYVLCSVGVEEYRRTIPMTVRSGDVVIEVGCHFGRTTTLLNEVAKEGGGYAIGIDIGPKIIKNAKSQYPSVEFAVSDGRRTLELLKLRRDGVLGYDAVYLDVGGLSGAHGTLEALSLIESIGNALEPRCIVIKSLCMKRLASRLRSFTLIWAKMGGGAAR